MCTSLEKGERVALGFLNTPPPQDPETQRLQRPKMGLSNQQVHLCIPAQNSELITCRRHNGQMGGSCREGVKPAA